MENLGKNIIILGILLILIGAAIFGMAKFNLPLGRLPGDIRIERPGGSFYFPLASSILVSVLLTILLNIILRLFRK